MIYLLEKNKVQGTQCSFRLVESKINPNSPPELTANVRSTYLKLFFRSIEFPFGYCIVYNGVEQTNAQNNIDSS